MAGMPPDPAAQASTEGAEDSGQSDFATLVQNVSDGLAMLTDVLNSMSPDAAKAVDGLNSQFQQIMDQAAKGQSQGGGQGVVSQEAGAAKVIPAGGGY